MKKLLSILLSALICFSSLTGLTVFAEETKTYKVQYFKYDKGDSLHQLDYINISNTSTEINEGESYISKLSPKTDTIEIDSLVVIMGENTPVYPTKNDDGSYVINIPKVSGDICIAVSIMDIGLPIYGGHGYNYYITNLTNVSSEYCNELKERNSEIATTQIKGCGTYFFKDVFTPDEGYEIVDFKVTTSDNFNENQRDLTDADGIVAEKAVTKNDDGSYTVSASGGVSIYVTAVAEPKTTESEPTSSKPTSTIPGGAYVTYNLTNVISSNMQEEVWGYYETTLSPVQGYKINYISVKQGDEDMPVIDNGDGTYTFKNEGGFTDNLTITAGAQLDTTVETSQEYSTTTDSDTQPTTTEQITTTTTPKSTIPGGAYVTYNLTNVISSNMQEEVWGYYETTFSPEPGYKINYISVKQGDKDMSVIDNGDGTYTFKNEGGFTDNLTITVKAKPFPTKLSVTDMKLYVGSSSAIDVIDGTAIDWKSSDEKVATVKNGNVSAVGAGTATITVTLSTYDYLRCNVKVSDYAEQPLPSTTQKFCDAVNQYIIDSGFDEMYFVETDENGNKVMLTPDNIKSNSAIKIYLETTNFAIFNIRGVLTACSEETIEGYTFNYNTTFTNDNPCGYCVYKNNKIYSIKDAVNKGITDIRTLAYVIPGTTKDGAPVTVDKNEYVSINHLYDSADCTSNRATSCKIGSRYTTTLEAKPHMNTEYIITNVCVIMNKDTFVAPKWVNDNKVIIDIPCVTGDITIGVLKNTKLYPAVGETLGCFATNMENVSYYRHYSDDIDDILIENQIFDCAVAPFYYKIVPDEGYEIVSVSAKSRFLNHSTGEYTLTEIPVEKMENNEYLVKEWGDIIIEGEVRKIPAELSDSQLSLKAGESKTLKVTDGTARSWSTSNKNVATVNNGKVTAVGKGTATITATLTTGEKLTCKVTVVNSPKLTSSKVILKSGTSKTIKAVGGTVKTWTTSNKNVATVKDGKITALNKGTATVTATLTTGKKLTCKVVVATAPRLTKTTVKVKKGNTATVLISGKVATIDNKYANTKIAKINSKVSTSVLKIKGLKKGETTLKIKVNGVKTLSLKVKVK